MAGRRAVAAIVAIAIVAVLVWWHWMAADVPSQSPAVVAAAVSGLQSRAMPVQTVRRPRSAPPGAIMPASQPANPQAALCESDRRQRLQARLRQLPAPGTADAAIEQALLTSMLSMSAGPPYRASAGKQWQAASRRWPDDLDLAWFSLQHCVEEWGCDRNRAWRHLASIDPDNAAVWMLAMETAMRNQDEAGYEQALRRAAEATFYDPRTGITFLHVRQLMAKLPRPASCLGADLIADIARELGHAPTAVDWADVEAMGFAMAVAMPSYSALSGCSVQSRRLALARRQDCMALLAKLAGGDSFIDQYLGLGLLIRLTGDGPGYAQLRERYRRLRWLQTQTPPTPYPEGYVMRLWSDGEVASWQALAIARGRWPPPADWLPPDARGRALIQTGRLPPGSR